MLFSGRRWRSRRLWALALLLAPSVAAAETAAVRRVLDGDSIVLTDGRAVRYLGINAPERGQPFHAQARQLNRILTKAGRVRLEFDRVRLDRYGRLLAYVYVGAEMVNARLLHEGLAHLFIIPPNLKHYERFLRLQEAAQRARRGMWRQTSGPAKITKVELGLRGPEHVRIANVSARPLDLAGFRLSDRARHSYRFPSVVLNPGYVLTLRSGAGADLRARSGPILLHWHSPGPIWNNSGDTAFLFGPDGRLIDRFEARPR
ncbi:MAG: thermonuclease family protein [Candidatus Methylomirabilia bacterium]